MGAELDELIRIGEQRQNAVADQIGRGEVPATSSRLQVTTISR